MPSKNHVYIIVYYGYLIEAYFDNEQAYKKAGSLNTSKPDGQAQVYRVLICDCDKN